MTRTTTLKHAGCALIAFVLWAFVLPHNASAQCSVEWTAPTSGNWNDAARWSGGMVPGADDHACITANGTYTVTLNINATVAGLTVGGSSGEQTFNIGSGRIFTLNGTGTVGQNAVVLLAGTLNRQQQLTIHGQLHWSANQIAGPGTLVLAGTGTIAGGSNKFLHGTLRNEGTISWEQGHLYLATDAVLDNRSQFLIGQHSSQMLRSGSAPQRFVNNGTVRRTAAGNTPFNLPFENNNLVDVQEGTLRLNHESYHHDATLAVASGASLLFDSGTHTVTGTLSGNPEGEIIHSATLVAGDDGAVFDFGGTGFRWHHNDLDGGPGLTNTGLIILSSGSNKFLRGTLRNEGTISWEQGHLSLRTDAVLDNRELFQIGEHSSQMLRTGGAPQRFVNNGTVRRTAAGNTPFNLPFENNSLIDVQAGTLRLNHESYHHDATLAVASGASLLFDSGTHTVTGTLSGNPEGEIIHSSTLVAGDDGAVFDFGGTGFRWHHNDLDGGPGLTNTGLIILSSGSNKFLRGTLRNEGTITWEQGHVYLVTNAVLENRELFLVGEHSSQMLRSGSAPQRFVNNATVRRMAAGNTPFNLPFENNSLIDVQAGTLRLNHESYHHDATLAVASGASFLFDSGTHTVTGTLSGIPEGEIIHSSTLVAGDDSAVLDFGGTGFRWHHNDLDGGPGLTNTGLIILSSGSNKFLRGTLRNEGTISWEQGHLFLRTDAVLDNRATFRAATAHGMHRSGAAPQRFDNHGTFIKENAQAVANINSRFNNYATVDVREGTLQFSHESDHPDVTLSVQPDAVLQFSSGTHTFTNTAFNVPAQALLSFSGGTRIFSGEITSAPGGTVQWTGGIMRAGAGGGNLNFTGTGLRWQGGSVSTADAVLSSSGIIHMDGSSAKAVSAGTFRNDGNMTWTQGILNVSANGAIENTGLIDVQVGAVVLGPTLLPGIVRNSGRIVRSAGTGLINIFPPFENRAGGSLAADAGTIRFRVLNNLADAVISGDGGTIEVTGSGFVNHGVFAPGASPGILNFSGPFRSGPTAGLQIELAGAEAGTGYDRLAVEGLAQLNGVLDVQLLDGYRPAVGTAFSILTSTGNVTGGFSERRGLVDVDAEIALYPRIDNQGVTLTAGVLTALEPELVVSPGLVVSGQMRTVSITGNGFAPDLTVELVCVECEEPELFPTVPGSVGTITPTHMNVTFDLRDGRSVGTYELVVRDPRGGQARADFIISVGPATVTVEATRPEAREEGLVPGAFTIRVSGEVLGSIRVPFQVSGTATRFSDYMLDVTGSVITIPAGSREVTVSVFPLSDDIAEPDETVILRLLPAEGYELGDPSLATVTIIDGPPSSQFAVGGLTPDRGEDIGQTTIAIVGQGFTPAASARLVGGGHSIDGTNVEVIPSGAGMSATFDLRNRPLGTYDLVVSNGDGTEQTLHAAFTVEQSQGVQVWADIVGTPNPRWGRWSTYTVFIGNAGNADVHDVMLILRIERNVDHELHGLFPFGNIPPTEQEYAVDAETATIIPLYMPVIPAGHTNTMTLRLRPRAPLGIGDAMGVSYELYAPPDDEPFTWSGDYTQHEPYVLNMFGRALQVYMDRHPPQSAEQQNADGAELGAMHVNQQCNNDWLKGKMLSEMTDAELKAYLESTDTAGSFREHRGELENLAPKPWAELAVFAISVLGAAALAPTYPVAAAVAAGVGLASGAAAVAVAVGGAERVRQGRGRYWSHISRDDCLPILGSADPNDKLGSPGVGEARYFTGAEPIRYVIRFENMPTASAPAQEVIISDTLDVNTLDLSTFALGSITFGDRIVPVPPGLTHYATQVDLRPEKPVVLHISAQLDFETARVAWLFAAIDPNTNDLPEDALIGFLPPNLTSPEGEGSVSFTVNLRENLPTGTIVSNEARIFFDLNDPIDTPVWSNTIDVTAPTSKVVALSERQTEPSFEVSWEGVDAGSGVKDYFVYVSTNDGPFKLWQSYTQATSAVFNGEVDSTYAFFSVARDHVGNAEPMKTEADAVTLVSVSAEDGRPGDELPTTFALQQNYPNPFNPSTTIKYAVPQAAHVRITIYDVLGRRIEMLVDEQRVPGWYEVQWDARRLASGSYFYRMEAGDFVHTRQLLLVK